MTSELKPCASDEVQITKHDGPITMTDIEEFDGGCMHTRSVPNVPELARYDCVAIGGIDAEMTETTHGEYVLYDQAAAFIESKEARISEVEQERQIMAKDWFDFCETTEIAIDRHEAVADKVKTIKARAEAAEADNKRLREALEPFVDHAKDRDVDDAEWRNTDTIRIVATVGQLRKARAALEGVDRG